MVLNDNEFSLFCLEVTRTANKYGVDLDTITTILAEAIKKREQEVYNKSNNAGEVSRNFGSGEQQVTSYSSSEMVVSPQVIYGPPPVQQTVEVYVPEQPIYGPPPSRR